MRTPQTHKRVAVVQLLLLVWSVRDKVGAGGNRLSARAVCGDGADVIAKSSGEGV